jgi:SAM-dependent methyltransferase
MRQGISGRPFVCGFFFCKPQRAKRSVARPRRSNATTQQSELRRSEPVQRQQRPELVAFDVSTLEAERIRLARFIVVAESPLGTAPGRILRLQAPRGVGRTTALRRLAEAAPGAVIARNDSYRSFLRPASERGRHTRGLVLAPAVNCAAGATIAMVDTAVDVAHPALAGANLSMLEMRAPDRQPSTARHGTAVASMLIGREGSPAPGLSPMVRLLAVDAFHRNEAGHDVSDAYDLARALDLLANQDADVINLSLAGPDNRVLANVVQTLLDRGRIIVAAAGNDGPHAKPLFPAAYSGVIAVSAVDGNDRPWRRSAAGQHVAFTALGVGLSLAGRDGGAEVYSGTSFAAPVVSAMLAARELRRGGVTLNERLVSLARDRGEPGRDPVYGHGVVEPTDACKPL